MKKRFLGILLAVVTIVAILPLGAAAADDGLLEIVPKNGEIFIGDGKDHVIRSSCTLEGLFVLNGTLTIPAGVTVEVTRDAVNTGTICLRGVLSGSEPFHNAEGTIEIGCVGEFRGEFSDGEAGTVLSAGTHHFEGVVCTDCGGVCEHKWDDGVCEHCGYHCPHTEGNGVCAICGYVCPHTWDDDVCLKCGSIAPHETDARGVYYLDKIVDNTFYGSIDRVTTVPSYAAGEVRRITEGDTKWGEYGAETWYVLDSDVTLDGIAVEGDVHIILCNGKTLRIRQPIRYAGNRYTERLEWIVSPYTGRSYSETVRTSENTSLSIYAQCESEKGMGTLICETEDCCILSENDMADIRFNGGNIILKGKGCIRSAGIVQDLFFAGGRIVMESTEGDCIAPGGGKPVHQLYFCGADVTMNAPNGSCICGASKTTIYEYLFEGEGGDRHYVGLNEVEGFSGYVQDISFYSGEVRLTSKYGCISDGLDRGDNFLGSVEYISYSGGRVILNSSDAPCISGSYVGSIQLKRSDSLAYGSDDPTKSGVVPLNSCDGPKYIELSSVIRRDATETRGGLQPYFYHPVTRLYYAGSISDPTEIGDEAAFEIWKKTDGYLSPLEHTVTTAGSVLSEGNLAILVGIAAAVVFGLGGFILGRKLKTPASAADGKENEE